MEQIFLISGLGADRRLFNKLDLPGYEIVYVDWIEPEPTDTIATYAKKLAEHYHIEPHSNILGVSLGGVMVVEISSIISLNKAIIVSSVKSASEFPWYFKLFRNFPLYKVIPHGFYSSVGYIIKPLFGKMGGKSGLMFVDMIRHSSPVFMRWAMHAILRWQPTPLNTKVYHIIGDKDLIFSCKRIKDADYIVKKGSHDMVYTRGLQISQIVQSILKNEIA
ncbi:alpha/beta hydrolase [Mucilaginibacter terrae]|uniref:alpha/beta hydrolase n=1 Tax=Mucilaginibacter terrae TaxID=1955052 RepID=UPI00362FAB74